MRESCEEDSLRVWMWVQWQCFVAYSLCFLLILIHVLFVVVIVVAVVTSVEFQIFIFSPKNHFM